MIKDRTGELAITAMTVVERSQNIRRVLSELGKRWQLGGVDDEFDGRTGYTCFWAQHNGKADRILIEIPNRRLNEELLSRVDISEYLNGLAKADSITRSSARARPQST